MATYEKLASGRWKAKIRRKGFPEQNRTFDTRALAEKWAEDIEYTIRNGVFRDTKEASKKSFHDILVRYRDEVTPLHKGSDSETIRINALLKDPVALSTMAQLSSSLLIDYINRRRQTGVSDATIRREMDLMGQVIQHARDYWNINLPTNPATGKIKPDPANPRDRRLEDGEEKWILKTLNRDNAAKNQDKDMRRNPFVPLYFRFALETAMRQGEGLELRWRHVSLKKQTAKLFDTKNTENREVPLSDEALEILRSVKEISNSTNADDHVFPITSDALKKCWTRCLATARKEYLADCSEQGIEPEHNFLLDLRWHDLRHEATSRLAHDVPLVELARITGHKDLRTLLRYYHAHASDIAKRIGKTGAARRAKENPKIDPEVGEEEFEAEMTEEATTT